MSTVPVLRPLQRGHAGNQSCGSGMFISDPGSQLFHPKSQIQGQKDSGSASENLSFFLLKKLFLRPLKYGPGCSSRIRILIFYPSRIPDPLARKAPVLGSESGTLQVTANSCLPTVNVRCTDINDITAGW